MSKIISGISKGYEGNKLSGEMWWGGSILVLGGQVKLLWDIQVKTILINSNQSKSGEKSSR